mmetsp:Transcript_20842/g.49422  ORF Transcript_20842/g.49422 Transcript_20842/m.49422 type:complete len:211 (+) Transcript_20842:1103-1735(+)
MACEPSGAIHAAGRVDQRSLEHPQGGGYLQALQPPELPDGHQADLLSESGPGVGQVAGLHGGHQEGAQANRFNVQGWRLCLWHVPGGSAMGHDVQFIGGLQAQGHVHSNASDHMQSWNGQRQSGQEHLHLSHLLRADAPPVLCLRRAAPHEGTCGQVGARGRGHDLGHRDLAERIERLHEPSAGLSPFRSTERPTGGRGKLRPLRICMLR